MKDVSDKIPMTAKLLSQKQALRKLNKNSETKQHHLTALWEKYSRAKAFVRTAAGGDRKAHKELFQGIIKIITECSRT
jgi:hypothetical protein